MRMGELLTCLWGKNGEQCQGFEEKKLAVSWSNMSRTWPVSEDFRDVASLLSDGGICGLSAAQQGGIKTPPMSMLHLVSLRCSSLSRLALLGLSAQQLLRILEWRPFG